MRRLYADETMQAFVIPTSQKRDVGHPLCSLMEEC